MAFLFFLVATIYSSVGFGGGSSYTALLALSATPYQWIPLLSLCCNLTVVLLSLKYTVKKSPIEWPTLRPWLYGSLPMAYLGAQTPLKEGLFFGLLGSILLLVSVILWKSSAVIAPPSLHSLLKPDSFVKKVLGFLLGTLLGYFSGLVGIGGGIFLAPLLYTLHWTSPEKVPSLCSTFIAFNSCLALIGHIQRLPSDPPWSSLYFFMVAVSLGSLLGTRWRLKQNNISSIQKITAFLIMCVAIRCLLKAFS